MEQVHGRTHLGVTFTEAEVANSHTLYAQHVRPLLEGGAVDCERCRDVAASAPPLPDITVYVITDGKAKDGRMQALLGQRQAEFARLCSHVELLIGAPASPACAAGAVPSSPAASGGRAAASPAAGGGGAAAAAAAAPQPRPALQAMTAQDVGAAVGRLGPPYKQYEQLIVDNNVHGKMAARVAAKPEAQALEWLVELGVASPVHRDAILMEFQSWSSL